MVHSPCSPRLRWEILYLKLEKQGALAGNATTGLQGLGLGEWLCPTLSLRVRSMSSLLVTVSHLGLGPEWWKEGLSPRG